MIASVTWIACVLTLAIAPPADAPEVADEAPESPATTPPPADAPGEVVIRVDPLDDARQRPQTVPEPAPAPVAPKTTEHYGIPSQASDRTEFPERGPSEKTAPSEEAAMRDTAVELDEKGKVKAKRPGSPQRFEFEVKLGPYLPDVDRLYDGPGLGPYATIYGKTDGNGVAIDRPRRGVMPVLGFEWQFLYVGGPLGIGTQVGFFRDKAKALLLVPAESGSVRSAADDTSFAMVPLALLLTYRLEIIADRFRVPLVPYAKAGLAYAFWLTRDGSGNISRNTQGERGRGGVPGWQINLGGMLRLDFIEPNVAKTFDKLTGINHTYVFGEYQLSRIANFGVGNPISLGASTWFAGMAIEF